MAGDHGPNMCNPFDPQYVSVSSRQYWDALKHDLRPIYTAPTEAAARAAFEDLADRWGKQYPAIIRL